MQAGYSRRGSHTAAPYRSISHASVRCLSSKSDRISLKVGVKGFVRAFRSHRGNENSCHGSFGMTYREDESRLREPHLRQNCTWLNRFTLLLPRQHPGKDSIAMKRRSCGWSEEFLTEVIAAVPPWWQLAQWVTSSPDLLSIEASIVRSRETFIVG